MKEITLALSAAALALAGSAVYAAAPKERDATMTRAEVSAKANEMWARLDVNKDGVVNPADREARRAAMFDRIDANKDGSVSREEFAAGHPGREGRGDHAGMAHDRAPGEGHRMGHGRRHGGMGGGMGKMMLHMADANKDGSVTKAEYDTAVTQHFDKVDKNRDGSITPAERQAAHAEMKAHMKSMRGHMGGGADTHPAQ